MSGKVMYKYINQLKKYTKKDEVFCLYTNLELHPQDFLSLLKIWNSNCPPKEVLDDFEKVILEDFHYFNDRIKIMMIEKVDNIDEIFSLISKIIPNMNNKFLKFIEKETYALKKMKKIILNNDDDIPPPYEKDLIIFD
jgi:hypothetical protein